jgi:hypothetical protein
MAANMSVASMDFRVQMVLDQTSRVGVFDAVGDELGDEMGHAEFVGGGLVLTVHVGDDKDLVPYEILTDVDEQLHIFLRVAIVLLVAKWWPNSLHLQNRLEYSVQ